ncbi:hypothetical protein [Streptomyces sp. NPDC051636]|uniref:hypothetical protein n=1 Tax=Streptomyces sp. NPDC051636 TaxID=3365663 RepID=UPI0037B4794A
MISGRAPGPQEGQAARLANEVEGYLLLHAERDQAKHEAQSLCARLPWLTTAQADDVTRHYIEQRLTLTTQALQITANRADRLRAQYEARYSALRHTLLKRHAACACFVLAVASTAGTSMYVLMH